MAQKYSSQPIQLAPHFREAQFYRADIKFHEVDHSGASYEGRVFLNNLEANEKTPKTLENGYAGSFYIFGHGGCFGDVGHCDARPGTRPYDKRPKHPVTATEAFVTITDPLKAAVNKSDTITLTVVPVIMAAYEHLDQETPFKFSHFDIELYDHPAARVEASGLASGS
jgi:tyrosinase